MIGYYGYRGAGKTLSLSYDLFDMFKKNPNLCVITNTPFFFPPHKDTGQIMLQYLWEDTKQLEPFVLNWLSSSTEVCRQRETVVVIDEANLVMPSRFFAKLEPWFLSFLAQSRKMNVEVIFTTQDTSRVDKVLRELCETWFLMEPLPLPFFHFIRRTEQHISSEGTVLSEMGTSYIFRTHPLYKFYNTFYKVNVNSSLLPESENPTCPENQFFDHFWPNDDQVIDSDVVWPPVEDYCWISRNGILHKPNLLR